MKIEYETEGLMVTHQAARSLFKIVVIDAARMREFDEMCLPSPKPAARKPARKAPGGGNRTAVPAYAAAGRTQNG
ncbi:MAG: DNA-binding transcriptional regulator [Treponematales bacterium]